MIDVSNKSNNSFFQLDRHYYWTKFNTFYLI